VTEDTKALNGGSWMSDSRTSFAILGPLQAHRNGVELHLGPFKQRVLLAAMLCEPNTVLPVEKLMEVVWDNRQPRTARKNLQVYISALRKLTGGHIEYMGYGYSMNVAVDELDVLSYGALATEARKAVRLGEPDRARSLFGEGLALWRDRPLVDLRGNSFLANESDALIERYLEVYEDWVDLEISAGRHAGVIDNILRLGRLHPFRERLVMALMTALCQAGDRKEALAHCEEHRQLMARELGLAPSSVLQRQYRDILVVRSGDAAPPASEVGQRRAAKPMQLPRAVPDFVGREDEIATLVAGTTGSSVALISGHTGTGKTALALHVGHLLAHRFVDGQVVVVMRDETGSPRPARDVVAELMRATGLNEPLPNDETTLFGLWRSRMADRRILFILDDASDETSLRRLLPGPGGSATIVTSCHTLGSLEADCRCQLGEFSEAEVLTLLEQALGSARVAGAGPAVRRIIALCGAQPLAFGVIAARLRTLGHVSLQAFADRLEAADDVLEELATGDWSVSARLETFTRGLLPRQRAAFCALGSLPSSTYGHDEVLVALGSLPNPERALEELLEVNLISAAGSDDVTAHQVRYVMPTAFHRYAAALYRRGQVDDHVARSSGAVM
jgi:DNA-binding SARP family transcriptional activator